MREPPRVTSNLVSISYESDANNYVTCAVTSVLQKMELIKYIGYLSSSHTFFCPLATLLSMSNAEGQGRVIATY